MTPTEQRRLQRLDKLAVLLDESIRIPVIGYRIGYDALIGLIPGFGDVVGLALATYIVANAARFHLPRSTLLRMIANVAIEAVIGSIPLIGDIFDATYKANLRNLRLLHSRASDPTEVPASDRQFLWLIIGIPVVMIVSLIGFLIWVLASLI